VRILLSGRNGQVGWELERTLAPLGDVIAFDRTGLDLAKPDEIIARVREVTPDIIVNAAAYTAVDKAESEPELAFAINATAPGILAEEAKRGGALFVHYSTEYVFDGSKIEPYVEDDAPNPLNAYGGSKLAGERAVAASGCRHLTLRTSWLYASRGNNFLLTVLRLARERSELRVVDDQRGAPTWAREIAEATAKSLQSAHPPTGLYHLTASGETTWCGFAREILRIAGVATPVLGIRTSEWPTSATRPANSVLSNTKFRSSFGFSLGEWDAAARMCLESNPAIVHQRTA